MRRFIWTRGVWKWLRDRYVLVEREGYDYDGPVAQAMDDPTMRQFHFQFFNDNGIDETDSTSKAAIDTDITGQNVDENFLVRIVVDETAGNANNNYTAQLQVRVDGGTYQSVSGGSTIAQAFDSTKISDGSDTTQRTGSGTFVTPNAGQDDVNGRAGSAALDFAGNDETEFVFCVQIIGSDVADGAVLDFRLDPNDIDTYGIDHGSVTSTGGTGGAALIEPPLIHSFAVPRAANY